MSRHYSGVAARRVWFYKKGTWVGPPISRGGDEYGNDTLVFRLPGERAMVVAWSFPLRRRLEPLYAVREYGLIGERSGGTEDNPLPISYKEAENTVPFPGERVVKREIWYHEWEPFDVDDFR